MLAPFAAAGGAPGSIQPTNVFDDAGDFFIGAGRAIYDVGKSAFDFVISNGVAVLELVVDGVKSAYRFVLDTVDRIFEAIN